jgi:hypothetical protein
MKPEPHRGLRYGSLFRQEDLSDPAQAKVLEIAIRPNALDLPEGSRQSALVDTSDAAQIGHLDERPYICVRYLLEMIDNLSIPLDSLCRSGRTSIVLAGLGRNPASRFLYRYWGGFRDPHRRGPVPRLALPVTTAYG